VIPPREKCSLCFGTRSRILSEKRRRSEKRSSAEKGGVLSAGIIPNCKRPAALTVSQEPFYLLHELEIRPPTPKGKREEELPGEGKGEGEVLKKRPLSQNGKDNIPAPFKTISIWRVVLSKGNAVGVGEGGGGRRKKSRN